MRAELVALGFYELFKTDKDPDGARTELRLKADHSLVAWFQAENRACGDDRKINGMFEFILLKRLSTKQIQAAQAWLMERFPPFRMRMRAVMWYEVEAA